MSNLFVKRVRFTPGLAAATVLSQQEARLSVNKNLKINRFFRLMTRRYRSFRSEVAIRPPANGTRGRKSGGITGIYSSIIHSGFEEFPSYKKASMTLRRLEFFRC